MTTNQQEAKTCSTAGMVTYSFGACTEAIIMNTFFGFAMLYYTMALGLSPGNAGMAAFIAGLWDAVSDPIMGHISDNTRSRFGKRHPYLVGGGVGMVLSFFFIWYVPGFFKSNMLILFWYLVVMNLILRTAYTVYVVPFTALGFEICGDYDGRAKLQGIRNAMNMTANILGCAMAWTLFFSNNSGDIRATHISQNYINMGISFTIVAAILIIIMLIFTSKYIRDSRKDNLSGFKIMDFVRDVKDIILDKYPRWVFIFIFFVSLGIVLVSALQMFVLEDFLLLSGWQKTVAHGGTMVGCGIGSLSAGILVKKLDKKGAVYLGGCFGVSCELILALMFLTGFLKPTQTIGWLPVSLIVFTIFHSAYWFGNGIMMPVALSMMADIAEIHEIETGVNKTASYGAIYSLAFKTSLSIGLLLSGYCLGWIGYVSGSHATQSREVIWRLCALTLVVGPVASLAALMLIKRYPVTKQFLGKFRAKRRL